MLAWHTDRLHRSPIELEEYIRACNDGREVPTHCVKAGTLDLSTPSGRMMARTLGTLARYESEHRGERVAAAALQRAQAGRRSGGPRPFGYEPDGVTVREADARVKWLGSGIYVCAGCRRPSLRVSTAGRGIPCYRCPGVRGTTGHVVRTAGPLDAYIEAVIVERLTRPDAVELLLPAAPEVDLSGLRATANAARARLVEIAEMLGEEELTRAEAQIARGRATARLQRAEAEIAAATSSSPLTGIVDAPDPAAVWAGLDIGRRRAVLDCLMTVTVLPITRPGPGFDPDTIRIEPKQQQA